MHILVVNDDGPPSKSLSPYIRPFVNTLQSAGHLVSVAIPASSRSWISKAHIRESVLKANYVSSDSFREDGTWEDNNSDNSNEPEPSSSSQLQNGTTENKWPWAIITNGTPASCVQLGLFNLFPDRPPVDLVVSGPNHGRNASSIYNLSSGTVGGALEAATCQKRAIALSFGSKDEQPAEVITAAARLAVRVIEHLYRSWDERVEVYNLNVPMRVDVEGRPVMYTRAFRNYWSRGCLYAEVESESNGDHHCNGNGVKKTSTTTKERVFAFSPDLADMKKGLQASPEGTDAHTVLNGCTSITPLLAQVSHASGLDGELKLDLEI
ncbi:hypothetical protein MPDQ_003035 [Monascus purpureus]|uniref:Survival protein SurE-like phosphatase/nucleotidase domain-containing protein n=1 Tax=Monascus purpureus TaxID=5098 RepID=A0A507R7C9_MONPU|nr:hypothetical protein MPDQ_003035 [Monascus purpureus]BDD59397.1 hypothetical protein MAP00_004606 [Monascus purpureus]